MSFLTLCCIPIACGAREIIDICKDWEFLRGPLDTCAETWERVNIPHTWNAEDMQLRVNDFYAGEGWYRKTIFIPESAAGKRLYLRFEGVGSCAEVYVNDKLIGTHKGAYSAFVCEMTGVVISGKENEIRIKADNSPRPDVIPVNNNLFAVYGGIYRPVSLIITEENCIVVSDFASSGVYISQENVTDKSADITIKTKLDNGGKRPSELILENSIRDSKDNLICKERIRISLTPQGTQTFVSRFKIKHPHLWQGRQDPYLYKVVSTLLDLNGNTVDSVIQPLGIRKYEIKAGDGFYLNGKKYPMYGVTRHQDWYGIGSALERKHHDADLDAIMEIGATTIRLAHYQQSDYIYSRCDTLGLIVWAEIPLVNKITGQEWENAHQQMKELVRQCYNHPCIYVWGIHNEVYHPHEYTSALTRSLHDLCKTEDPYRYTSSVNGYGRADHPVNLNADIQGMNRYYGWYEKRLGDFLQWVEGLEKEYPWMKLMLTEYGADANIAHQTELVGDALNWGEPFYPETFQTLTHETHWSMIEQHPYIIASYLWNMFDFAVPVWERGGIPARNMKGLITFDRNIRKDSFYWYKANWSKSPVLYITQRRNIDREKKTTSITIYSNVGTPEITLNGRNLPGLHKGLTDVHFIIDNVILDEGENIITATVTYGDEKLQDTIKWIFNEEKSRNSAYAGRNIEHGGWIN